MSDTVLVAFVITMEQKYDKSKTYWQILGHFRTDTSVTGRSNVERNKTKTTATKLISTSANGSTSSWPVFGGRRKVMTILSTIMVMAKKIY
jgi:hypothetical protein